jgi:hypothetical protein
MSGASNATFAISDVGLNGPVLRGRFRVNIPSPTVASNFPGGRDASVSLRSSASSLAP